MATSLDSTLQGQQVTPSNNALLGSLSPDALLAALQLTNIDRSPTPADIAAGNDLATQLFGPVLQQIQNTPAPTPEAVPSVASPGQQALALFASNLAETTNPGAGQAARQEITNQQAAARETSLRNLERSDQFRTQQTSRALATASQAAQAALSAALEAGDHRGATQAALATAKLNAALDKENRIALEREKGRQERSTITHSQQAEIGLTTFKKELERSIEGTTLSGPGKTRMAGEIELIGRWLSAATRVDPNTGQAALDPSAALDIARKQFNTALENQILREGHFSIPGGMPNMSILGGGNGAPASATGTSGGISDLGARLRARRLAEEQ